MEKDYVELIIPITKSMVTELDYLKSEGELVRCRDCNHKGDPFKCHLDSDLQEHGGCRTEKWDNWFCADGETREQDGRE